MKIPEGSVMPSPDHSPPEGFAVRLIGEAFLHSETSACAAGEVRRFIVTEADAGAEGPTSSTVTV